MAARRAFREVRMQITIHHGINRQDVALGLVVVDGVEVGDASAALKSELDQWIAKRKLSPLSATEEALRGGSRDILRNGTYKPTGRGKPASEYLLRAATEESFPRINGPVDANNLVSIKYCLAISVWDIELAETHDYEFRLGRAGESYVFNPTGQSIELTDLICGCGLRDGTSRPIVNPIKDSMATKLRPTSRMLGGVIYFPLSENNRDVLEQATAEFLRLLKGCGLQTRGASAVCLPASTDKAGVETSTILLSM